MRLEPNPALTDKNGRVDGPGYALMAVMAVITLVFLGIAFWKVS